MEFYVIIQYTQKLFGSDGVRGLRNYHHIVELIFGVTATERRKSVPNTSATVLASSSLINLLLETEKRPVSCGSTTHQRGS